MMFLRKNVTNILIAILPLVAFSCKSYVSIPIPDTSSSSVYSYYEETYYFPKPENIFNVCKVYKEMRTEITQQGGEFMGDKKAGVYTFKNKNVQGSYRILNNKVVANKIVFNIRYYNEFPAVPANYSFSVGKPGNITEVLQSARNGIVKNNGTFEGNDQQGTFTIQGIKVHYNVTTFIAVIILDKPLGIPNSLIEKAIKDYLNGK